MGETCGARPHHVLQPLGGRGRSTEVILLRPVPMLTFIGLLYLASCLCWCPLRKSCGVLLRLVQDDQFHRVLGVTVFRTLVLTSDACCTCTASCRLPSKQHQKS